MTKVRLDRHNHGHLEKTYGIHLRETSTTTVHPDLMHPSGSQAESRWRSKSERLFSAHYYKLQQTVPSTTCRPTIATFTGWRSGPSRFLPR